MLISDWSSDVCSSDLPGFPAQAVHRDQRLYRTRTARQRRACLRHPPDRGAEYSQGQGGRRDGFQQGTARSEEHTSELQSLLRISYAVFCLKKKTTQPTNLHHHHIHKPTNNTPHL